MKVSGDAAPFSLLSLSEFCLVRARPPRKQDEKRLPRHHRGKEHGEACGAGKAEEHRDARCGPAIGDLVRENGETVTDCASNTDLALRCEADDHGKDAIVDGPGDHSGGDAGERCESGMLLVWECRRHCPCG